MCCLIENFEILLDEERKLLLKGDFCLFSSSSSPSSSSTALELFFASFLSKAPGKKKRGIPNFGSSDGLGDNGGKGSSTARKES